MHLTLLKESTQGPNYKAGKEQLVGSLKRDNDISLPLFNQLTYKGRNFMHYTLKYKHNTEKDEQYFT